jgi:zinc D-Ala-D-Ala carboxypeptidase
MGDLSKNFSKLEIMCPCNCGADKISPVLIKKLQKVRNIIGRPLIITSGVRCEFYNESIKASMSSSHVPDDSGTGNAVDIACTNSNERYELVEVAQKFFQKIGISGGSYGGFIHLDVDRSKAQEVMWLY